MAKHAARQGPPEATPQDAAPEATDAPKESQNPLEGVNSATISQLIKAMAEEHPELKLTYDRAYLEVEDLDEHIPGGVDDHKYPTAQAMSRLSALLEIPQVDQETGVYTDEEGAVRGTRSKIIERTGIDPEEFDERRATARRTEVRARSGHLVQAYHEDDILYPPTELDQPTGQPVVIVEPDKVTKVIPKDRGNAALTDAQKAAAAGMIEAIGNITPDTISESPEDLSAVRWNLVAKAAPGDVGRFLESVGASLTAAGIRLTQSELRSGHSAYERAVTAHYDGGLAAMRRKLGVADTVKEPVHDWEHDPDPRGTLLSELEQIPDDELTGATLLQLSLWRPLERYYDGGYRQYRQDRGLPELKRPDDYWQDPANIRAEVAGVIAAEGSLSRSRAMKEAYGDIFVAIARHYPGGMEAILREFDQESGR